MNLTDFGLLDSLWNMVRMWYAIGQCGVENYVVVLMDESAANDPALVAANRQALPEKVKTWTGLRLLFAWRDRSGSILILKDLERLDLYDHAVLRQLKTHDFLSVMI